MKPIRIRPMFLSVAGLLLTASLGDACSRVLWADNGTAVVVGRTMDWFKPQHTSLWVLPRGIERDGQAGPGSLSWKARYGSLVTAVPITDETQATCDGMNDAGLAAHMLWLAESNYGSRDSRRPALSITLWTQYYLDNFATVADAVAFTKSTPYQLVTCAFDGETARCHLALEDVGGDSAIIEFVEGSPKIYQGRDTMVMTNSPTYDKQVSALSQYAGFGGQKPLPGTNDAADRFVRAAYYLKDLPKPTDRRECIAGILSVMRNVSQPFGTIDPIRPNISPTLWRTVSDLTDRVYYYESTSSPNVIWVDVNTLDFSPGAPVKTLDLADSLDRVGDCSAQFVNASPFRFPGPDTP